MSATHAAHSDHASRVAAWLLIPASLTGPTSLMRVVSLKSDSPRCLPCGRGERVYEETNDGEPSGTSPPLIIPRYQYTNCNGCRLANRSRSSSLSVLVTALGAISNPSDGSLFMLLLWLAAILAKLLSLSSLIAHPSGADLRAGRSSRFVPKALCSSIRGLRTDGKIQPSGIGGRCPASGPSQAE